MVVKTPLFQQARMPVVGTFIVVAVFGLYLGRDFLLPVMAAFLLAFTFRPSIRYLAKRHVPPWLTASIFLGTVTIGSFLTIYFLIDPVTALVSDAPHYAQTFADKIRGIRNSIDAFVLLTEKLQAVAVPVNTEPLQEVVVKQSSLMSYVGQVTGYSAGMAKTLILTLVIAGFLMASGDLFYAKLVRVLPTLTDKKRALRIVYDVEHEVSSYLLIVTGINAALWLSIALTFYALGMPMPYLWGLLAFTLNFNPYIGSICAIVLVSFMSVVTFDSVDHALLLPMAYAFWNGFENQVVSPLLLGRRLQLNSVAILLSIAFWTWIWGFAGTMIAVPILVTFKVFCDHTDGWSGVDEFLSAKYPEDKEASAEGVSA
jgi:predicted PurR-regulated permease PerM